MEKTCGVICSFIKSFYTVYRNIMLVLSFGATVSPEIEDDTLFAKIAGKAVQKKFVTYCLVSPNPFSRAA